MTSSLSVREVRTYGKSIRRGAEQPTVPPGNQLISVLKTKGKGTEFAVDVTNPLTYLVAICSLGQINTGMNLYQVSNEDLTRCVVS